MEIKINIGGLTAILLLVISILALAGFLAYRDIIRGSDFIIVIATLLGPILAVQIQALRERIQRKQNEEDYKKNEVLSRQRLAFRQMMAYRANPTDPFFVQALNIVPVDFKGISTVETSWKNYFQHLCTKQEENPNWIELSNDRRCELLASMAKHLGYEFSLQELKDEKYMSEGYFNEMVMKSEIIKGAHKMITEGYPLTVLSYIKDAPTPETDNKTNPTT
ncbi:DUF6680 family protein [Yersinia enterocolitica]|uniref:DUF6680 family protein n=1 Tax=Yersinia mollaretii TaxID=33060 RepID=UPI001427EC42|nr:DUF6680 family protein [Yersinia mollaretii]MDA5534596.1 hypothetical protein [Yersinia mollaretii]NIL02518.1 hypothetical protein [Yersinia mollaretii]HEN3433795.1 hypothetical protein [Yersinia enterocolitica]